MTTTHYHGSRGPVPIASMALPHLTAARDKLKREQPARTDEIEAMTARIAHLESLPPCDVCGEPQFENASGLTCKNGHSRVEAAPGPASQDIGANNPPAPTTFETVKARLDGLMIEARNWADGATIESQAQADTVARLMEEFRRAAKAADDARKAENEEFDRGKAAVQAKYAPLIADTKAQRGVAVLALESLKAVLTPWLRKVEAEREAIREAARKEAEEAAAKAAEAARAAQPDDLASVETAAELALAAADAFSTAKQAENAKAHAHGGGRATALRSYWTPVLVDPKEALLHYLARRPDQIRSMLEEMARQDVATGVRAIPGFRIDEDRRVA